MNFDVKRMIKFCHNVGLKDQKIRYITGCAAIFISVFKAWILLLLLGIILVGTAYLTWCPILSGFGRDSFAMDKKPEQAENSTNS